MRTPVASGRSPIVAGGSPSVLGASKPPRASWWHGRRSLGAHYRCSDDQCRTIRGCGRGSGRCECRSRGSHTVRRRARRSRCRRRCGVGVLAQFAGGFVMWLVGHPTQKPTVLRDPGTLDVDLALLSGKSGDQLVEALTPTTALAIISCQTPAPLAQHRVDQGVGHDLVGVGHVVDRAARPGRAQVVALVQLVA